MQHAIWWHVYPLGFTGAEQTREAGAPVRHLHSWLDYALELGVSGLVVGPIFASETYGYDTTDHFRIDPRLGDDADFDALVDAAAGRGLRIMLDGVFNHVGRSHPAFRRVLDEGPVASTVSWFRLRWSETPPPGTRGPCPTTTTSRATTTSSRSTTPATTSRS